MNHKIKKVVIAGGGTAGWMTAAALTKLAGDNLEVVLVESDEIGTVGVGEATIPTLHLYHRLLGLKEQEVMAATNATFKLGINFENWHDVNKDYLHSFGFLGKDCWACGFQHFWVKGQQKGMASGIGDYCTEHLAAREGRFAILPNQDYNHAYHLDATLYAKFLRQFAEQRGIKRQEGKIVSVNLHQQANDSRYGHIQSLTLASGETLEGDLFIDCTGFRALLIEQSLNTGFEDWSHWLPCDSAIAVQTTSVEKPLAYTRSIARDSGWQWRIPLQTRTGNGFVFCSKYMTDEQATQTLMDNIEGEPLNQPRVIKFRTGTRRQHWNKNCVAIGLSSGFLEPLESTSIHMIQRSIIRLLQMFPSQGIVQADVNEFNQQTKVEIENIRDFIILHYKVTDREDSAFWRYCKNMPIPESLAHRIELFQQSGKIYKLANELFGESSWIQVMMGQGLIPQQYHPIVDLMPDEELQQFLNNIRDQVTRKVKNLPNHVEFINHYCQSSVV
ncbi:tryptophan halogenase family protein [Shewanella gaetbuli]|uniref:Tryptophan 7-halogenase n=1 Tax=Shewanella gaetbuli TaxID=220752 RepID=A0A9X1ZXI2_9GAMM|nr:tryptophan halogenase family protein [Shewanella gaetbuli]MCL1144051.1 tryptophan 7-halogenase [Shewanella gaetbuli]